MKDFARLGLKHLLESQRKSLTMTKDIIKSCEADVAIIESHIKSLEEALKE